MKYLKMEFSKISMTKLQLAVKLVKMSLNFYAKNARCLKFTEKVSFNIASEASYVTILSVQKLIKNAKNGPFWRVIENLKLAGKQCYQTCQFFYRTKIGGKCQN